MPKANKPKSIKNNNPNANASMAMLFLVVGSVLTMVVGGFFAYIGLFLNANVASTFDKTLVPVAATGTLTWTGNSACGDFVNITTAGGTLVPFYVNVTGTGCPAAPNNYAVVSIANTYNTSTGTATNLTTAINANTTISAIATAGNPSNGVVTLTYYITGTEGNGVKTSDSAVNASWAASTLTGGVAGSSAWAGTKANVMTGYTIIGILFIIVGAAGCIIALMSVVGQVGGGNRR